MYPTLCATASGAEIRKEVLEDARNSESFEDEENCKDLGS